jgi:hypothetical protein
MKLFSLSLLVVSPLFIAVNGWPNIRDAPSTTVDIQDGQTGTLMVLPPRQTDTGTKRVPGMSTNRHSSYSAFEMCTLDADHPFIAPGPNDMRGRELLLLEDFDPSLLIIFHSMPCVPVAVKMLRLVSDIM